MINVRGGSTFLKDQTIEDPVVFNTRVDLSINQTIFFFQIETSATFKFSLVCLNWGKKMSSGYAGLVIRIIKDNNNQTIRSLMILHEDTNEHIFETEENIIGIIRILFALENIESVDLSWQTAKKNIWSYSNSFLIDKDPIDFYFGIERSENNYSLTELFYKYFY